MREILFRGQTRRKGEKVRMDGSPVESNWVYGGIFQGLNRSVIYGYDPIEKYVVYSDTVGQFTGLTDKNGTKIFEGDIVKCRHRLVKFYLDDIEKINPRRSYGKEIDETDSYGFSCSYWRNYAVSFRDGCIRIQNRSDHHEIRANYIYNHKIEVIGNIHDNPELLEKK